MRETPVEQTGPVAQVRVPVLDANLGYMSLLQQTRDCSLFPCRTVSNVCSNPHKRPGAGVFWQKRYYDRNVRNEREFQEKLRYLHRNPVKRGLCERPQDWKWSSFRHYALREKRVVEIESEWTARDRERETNGAGERMFLVPG